MKKTFYIIMVTLTTSLMVHARANMNSMNLEGKCQGKLADNRTIEFTYYSDFDGCKEKSQAGITFSSEVLGHGLLTGVRSFTETVDNYAFKNKNLTFKNSTGNTGGEFTYRDSMNQVKTIPVTCQIRNYEYAPCQ
jgi:hypothetical protein